MKTVLRIGIMFVLSVVLCLCYGAAAFAEDVAINETNFPDVAFREYVAMFDKDINGILSDEERASVQIMSLGSKGIASLEGIKFFTGLKHLYCYSNQLTSLDISCNTALITLYCSSNQLSSLDISHNTSLTNLNCGSNRLSNLDVNRNTSLTNLSCYSNRLTSLDISRNTSLTNLSCYDNQLITLDVSNQKFLTSLHCNFNQLAYLDVSGNTSLTTLNCYSNYLTSLDISSNFSLRELNCNSNQLTSLDVSHNMSLSSLICWGNQLTRLNIGKCSGLNTLQCFGNKISVLDISYCPDLLWMVDNLEPEISYGPVRYSIGGDSLAYDRDVTLITTHGPDLILPPSLTAIESEAFTGGAFTYVLVPEGVEAIGSGAFAGCPNLRYVEICGTQTLINDTAFDGVTGLTIIAPTGSKAETWAAEHDVNFQPAA